MSLELRSRIFFDLLKYYPQATIKLTKVHWTHSALDIREYEQAWGLWLHDDSRTILAVEAKTLENMFDIVRGHIAGLDILKAHKEMNKPLMFNDVFKQFYREN